MADPKKGQLHQLFVTLVDSTDFATIESAITASQFNVGTRKFYGLTTGGSAATTSGAISKAASLVRSGVFRLTLKGTENNYDLMQVRIAGITGVAEQIYEWETVDNDDSDILSALTVIQSMASDAASAAQQGNSRVLLVQSRLSDFDSRLVSDVSDIRSMLSDMMSDFQSRVPKAVATNSQLSDLASDLRSFLVVMSGVQSDIYSALSDFQSDFTSKVPKRVATDSQLSDLASDLKSLIVAGAGLTASAISDIASAVRAIEVSDLSDILSAAQQANSRILVVQSFVSDIRSHVSDLQSDFQSRVPKLVATNSQVSDLLSDVRSALAAGVPLDASTMSDLRSAVAAMTFTLSASDISDVASAVRATIASDLSDILSAAQQGNSRILVVQSMASDVGSAVAAGVSLDASTISDLRSAIAALTVSIGASDISDIASAVRAGLVSDLSDILSAAQQTNSRALVIQSMVSDVRSHVSDLQSDFQSRVPKRVATDSQLSDLASDLKSAIGGITVNLTTSDISDIASAVAAAVTTITASDISDIASRVDQVLASRLSDILSAAQQINSRVAAGVPLQASDMSDLRSAIAATAFTLSTSDVSDIASAVKGLLASDLSDLLSAAQQANSRVLVVQSHASNIYSLLSDVDSNLQSRIPKRVATDSQLSALVSDVLSALAAGVPVAASDMSDIRSAIAAGTLTASAISDIASAVAVELASSLSDILSAAQQGNSRLLVNQSHVSNIYSLLSDLHSDVDVLSGVVSDVHSALAAGVELGVSSLSDLRSAISAHGVNRAGAEPTSVVEHGDTLADKVDFLTALARNAQTLNKDTGIATLLNDAQDATIASRVDSDDGTTYSKGEFA